MHGERIPESARKDYVDLLDVLARWAADRQSGSITIHLERGAMRKLEERRFMTLPAGSSRNP